MKVNYRRHLIKRKETTWKSEVSTGEGRIKKEKEKSGLKRHVRLIVGNQADKRPGWANS